MVMCQDTDYVLLDEPLNNIDMHHAVNMMQLLRRFVDEKGKTVVVVLHDVNFASCYADHIIAMRGGRLAWQGAPETVIDAACLTDLYGIPVQVHVLGGQRICVYYRPEITAAGPVASLEDPVDIPKEAVSAMA